MSSSSSSYSEDLSAMHESMAKKIFYRIVIIVAGAFVTQMFGLLVAGVLWWKTTDIAIASVRQDIESLKKRADERDSYDREYRAQLGQQFSKLNDSVQQMIGKADVWFSGKESHR